VQGMLSTATIVHRLHAHICGSSIGVGLSITVPPNATIEGVELPKRVLTKPWARAKEGWESNDVYVRRQEKHTRAYSLSAFLRAKTPAGV